MSKISEQKALEKYPPHYQKLAGDGYFDMFLEKREGYIVGYDQAMQDFLEKAMEYFKGKPIHHFWVEHFKKYMEEQQ